MTKADHGKCRAEKKAERATRRASMSNKQKIDEWKARMIAQAGTVFLPRDVDLPHCGCCKPDGDVGTWQGVKVTRQMLTESWVCLRHKMAIEEAGSSHTFGEYEGPRVVAEVVLPSDLDRLVAEGGRDLDRHEHSTGERRPIQAGATVMLV